MSREAGVAFGSTNRGSFADEFGGQPLMYARLWWKDARQLWPIWAFLAVAAAIGQWLALKFWPSATQPMGLSLLALMWASFYAIASGAAAFAGEREADTLRLLDIMPVARPVTWTGKVSFALLTTIVLVCLLLAMAALGMSRRAAPHGATFLTFRDGVSLAVVVLEGLAWGLFWSALLSSALSAAVAAIFCTGVSWIVLLAKLDTALAELSDALRQLALWQSGIALVAMAASYLLFTWRGRPNRLRVALRSPVVVAWTGFRRPKPARPQLDLPDLFRLPRAPSAVSSDAPAGFSTASIRRPWFRTWFLAARALAWETVRESGKTWFLLGLCGLLGVLPSLLAGGPSVNSVEYVVFADIVIALAAGVRVFGVENRAGTQRFLNYHAAHPRLIYLIKVAVWCVGLAAIWGLQVIAVATLPQPVPSRDQLILLAGALALPIVFTFSVAQLCGMVIRRGITALIAAMILTAGLAAPLVVGISTLIMPLWAPLVIAFALLAVSWTWSRDWVQSRPAPGRWLRLGLLLLGSLSSVFAAYASYRVLSVPSDSSIAVPQRWVEAARPMPAPERNAAELYREAGRRVIVRDPSKPAQLVKQNSEALELARHAAAQPECWFGVFDGLSAGNGLDAVLMDRLAELVVLDTSQQEQNGNLDAAWDDIVLLFGMARQLSEGTGGTRSLAAWSIERDALGLALAWTIAPKQTPERLHAALAAYRALPGMVQFGDVAQSEASLTEKILSLPTDDLRSRLIATQGDESWQAAWVDVITLPWEVARARRVARVFASAYSQTAAQQPFQRLVRSSDQRFLPEFNDALVTTPLAARLLVNMGPYIESSDRNEVGRRALVQVLALRAWQLRHDGRMPDRLDQLVPEELPSLPDDPYTGRAFGYIPSDGQAVPSLRDTLGEWLSYTAGSGARSTFSAREVRPWGAATGCWLLYSVGPDFRDNRGDANGRVAQQPDQHGLYNPSSVFDPRLNYDIVFPIPPLIGWVKPS
jgi:ABC-type transport system involved in multi-copper enzyme maturation permease subunit